MNLFERIRPATATQAIATMAWLFSAGCSPDASVRGKIVGTWASQSKESLSVTTYHSDGTWVYSGRDEEPKKAGAAMLPGLFLPSRISVVGTWKVVDGRLVCTVTNSDTDWIKAGEVSSEKIVSVNATTLQLRPQIGDIETWQRAEQPIIATSRPTSAPTE
jgi:hypothetical protein